MRHLISNGKIDIARKNGFSTEGDSCPEQNLWRAVIAQAVMDACSVNQNSVAEVNKHHAEIYLRGNTRGFYDVCDMAGIHPEYAKKIINFVMTGEK